jgi:GNAT superfamily N-acetyltransferase
VDVKPVRESTSELVSLWSAALDDATKKRGGQELLSTIRGDVADDELLEHLIKTQCLWSAHDGVTLMGFALCRDAVVETLYVERQYRRQGVARLMLHTLLAREDPPVDAYALPGDRATKSLYESINWKARLLTMRGA